MRIRAAAGLASIAVLAGCGGSAADPLVAPPASQPSQAPQQSAAPTTPSALVGQWTVAGTGVAAGTVLNLAADGLALFQACGALEGNWLAGRAGTFLAEVKGGDSVCFPDEIDDPTPPWIASAAKYAVDGATRRLLDAGGQTLATLTASAGGGAAGPVPTADPGQVAALDAPTPSLPAGVRPATEQELVGVWLMPGVASSVGDEGDRGAHAEFLPDGLWGGSDGCNGTAGRWALVEGALLFTDDTSTIEGCTPVAVLGGARAVGFAGEALVLVDRDGRELRRLTREQATAAEEQDGPDEGESIDDLMDLPTDEPSDSPSPTVE